MSRVIPTRGTEAQRAANVAKLYDFELNQTTDQKRLFLQSQLAASVYHGSVADQTAMTGLNGSSSRGCWPFDLCYRADTFSYWICNANNGTSAGEWSEISPPRGAAVADVATSPPADGTIAALTFSATPTQAECEALRDQCEILRDSLAAAITTIHALRDRLKVTGGSRIIAD